MKPEAQSLAQRIRGVRDLFAKSETVFSQEGLALAEASHLAGAIEHPRSGSYVLGVEYDGRLPMPVESYDSGARVDVSFQEGGQVRRFTCGHDPSPFWSGATSGLFLLRYEVPAQVPLRATIDITVTTPATLGPFARWRPTWFVRNDPRK